MDLLKKINKKNVTVWLSNKIINNNLLAENVRDLVLKKQGDDEDEL